MGVGIGHQGLELDAIVRIQRHRWRDYLIDLARFCEPDPAGYSDGLSLYGALAANPVTLLDPTGLSAESCSLISWHCRRTTGSSVRACCSFERYGRGIRVYPQLGLPDWWPPMAKCLEMVRRNLVMDNCTWSGVGTCGEEPSSCTCPGVCTRGCSIMWRGCISISSGCASGYECDFQFDQIAACDADAPCPSEPCFRIIYTEHLSNSHIARPRPCQAQLGSADSLLTHAELR